MKRPLLVCSAGLLVGTAVAAGLRVDGWIAPLVLALVSLLAFSFSRGRPRLTAALLFVSFACIGCLLWVVRHEGPPGDSLARYAAEHDPEAQFDIVGRVERSDILLPGDTFTSFILRTEQVARRGSALPVKGGVLIRWSQADEPVFAGERVRVRGPLTLAIGYVNPSVNGVEDFYRRRDVHTALRAYGPGAIERVDTPAPYRPGYALSRFRNHLARRLQQAVPESSLPFVLTVWLGDRRRIDQETYTSFLDSGTAHILAVSGVHTGIVYVGLAWVLPLIVRGKRLRLVLLLIVLAAFTMLAGARISTVRAATMIAIYLAGDWFDRERDPLNALGISAMVFTLHRPDVLFDVAFQLSFSSVASILLFSDAIAARISFLPAYLRQSIAATVSVQILPLPIALHAFHVLPLMAPLANLLVIPVLAITLILSLLTTLAVLVLPPVAPLFGHALHPFVLGIQLIVERLGAVSRIDITSPTLLAVVLWMATAWGLYETLRRTRHRFRYALATLSFLLLTVAAWKPWSQEAEVTVLDVGHGNATFVRAPGGATMLVDAGNRWELSDTGKRYVAPFLWANHEAGLDALVVSHPDGDHIGGAVYVLNRFRVGTVFLGPRPFADPLEQELIELCRAREVPVVRLAKGDRFALGDATVEILHPPRAWTRGTGINDYSLTLRVQWPGMVVLLPGDVEAAGERMLVDAHPSASVLVVPHHGSITSSSSEFIEAVDPDLAIVSVGPRGRRSVLSSTVLGRYKERGIPLLRTDIAGGIRIVSRDGVAQVTTERQRRGYPMRVP